MVTSIITIRTANTTATPAVRVTSGSITSTSSIGIYNNLSSTGMVYVTNGTITGVPVNAVNGTLDYNPVNNVTSAMVMEDGYVYVPETFLYKYLRIKVEFEMR